MKHLEKVREALGKIGFFDREDMKAMDTALSALTAHEQEVRELKALFDEVVDAFEDAEEYWMLGNPSLVDKCRKVRAKVSALRPFGDEK